jgi:chemotaxis family two-component system sensor kinase Cph1
MQKINYDSDFCGKLPLHQTNLIQPHGILLIADPNSGEILQASENTEDVFGYPAREIAGKSLGDFLLPATIKLIQELPALNPGHRTPVMLALPGGQYMSTVSHTGTYLLMEVEKEKRKEGEVNVFLYQQLKQVMASIDAARTTEETGRIVINELQKLSGFDKIMIYQFDEHWNGDVIAETLVDGMDSYLGLKFPASDIPKQARELYRKTPFRFIPDVNYEPVRLYPVINPLSGAFTDLSDSTLRSVAGVHIEYLKNMNVSSSMSTRILVEGELWGLIACHHRSPKYLSYELCSLFELLSQVISAKISVVQKQEFFESNHRMQTLYSRLVENIFKSGSMSLGLLRHEDDVLELLHADGAALVLNQTVETIGEAPDMEFLEELIMWVRTNGDIQSFHHHNLSAQYEPAEAYAGQASGLLVLPLDPGRGHYLLAFRSEAIQKVNWGGNPEEAIRFEADRKNYHPRNSFVLWQQTVEKTSLPWSPQELHVAEQFRTFLAGLNKDYSVA